MGCDIHLFVEVRDAADAPWRLQRVTWTPTASKRCPEPPVEVGYDWRNYNLFSILADVRNTRERDRKRREEFFRRVGVSDLLGWGDQSQGFNPIAEPRGVPEDISAELRSIIADEDKAQSDAWEQHVFSYKEAVGDFYTRFIPALAELGFEKDNVRLVFGFDS